jgi:SAM-dependent methyltransferase
MGEYDRASWERRWTKALRDHGDRIGQRPPNPHLVAETGDLPPGRALDAGCGNGSETLWLAARGWRVTAVDFAAAALAHARSTAEAMGSDVADRVDWVEGDLGTWTPRRRSSPVGLGRRGGTSAADRQPRRRCRHPCTTTLLRNLT